MFVSVLIYSLVSSNISTLLSRSIFHASFCALFSHRFALGFEHNFREASRVCFTVTPRTAPEGGLSGFNLALQPSRIALCSHHLFIHREPRTMAIDRERRLARDRARRAAIKAGVWNFPNGGNVELARAGLPIDAQSKTVRYQAIPSVFIPSRASAARASASPDAPISASRALTVPTPHVIVSGARQSMVAIGGSAGRGYAPSSIAEATASWRANMQAMVGTLAAKTDAQERRIAALEKERADRQIERNGVAKAFFAILQYVQTGRA
jgi:hypothetical protein